MSREGGIGFEGNLPWDLVEEKQLFARLTKEVSDPSRQNAVIMGRRTWMSLPSRVKPLPGRLNVVLTTNEDISSVRKEYLIPQDVIVVNTLWSALVVLGAPNLRSRIENIHIIGGIKLYEEALSKGWLSKLHLTFVDSTAPCDVHLENDWLSTQNKQPLAFTTLRGHRYQCVETKNVAEESGISWEYMSWRGVDLPEQPVLKPCKEEVNPTIINDADTSYLSLITQVFHNGNYKIDRTTVSSLSFFGTQHRYDLSRSFPLLTTKRVFWRGVVEELLWFIRGSTDSKLLAAKGVHIWDGNGSRAALDALGFSEREEGDLGQVYGFQWRHFGAKYATCHDDYQGEGYDQLAAIRQGLKENPHDRRLILSAWNPPALKDMALPPCHVLAQFYVIDGCLSCQMYQRSADIGLGVPFNISSYALLTCILAADAGLQPGEFIHVLGDAHIYVNHLEGLVKQLENDIRALPTLEIAPFDDIEALTIDHFILKDYTPHKKISMQMAL